MRQDNSNMQISSPSYSKLFWAFWATFGLWFSGIFGTTLYAFPALYLFYLLAMVLYRGQGVALWVHLHEWAKVNLDSVPKKWVLIFVAAQAAIWCLLFTFKYYSFQLHSWDAGIHANIIFNFAFNQAYSSYLNVHPFGDHFTPILWPISLLYKIQPSILWVMAIKAFSFAWTGYLFFPLAQKNFSKSYQGNLVGLLAMAWWFFFYKPAVHSFAFEFQASSLAAPFILLAFISLQAKSWLKFWLFMFLMLTTKEHLGAVWIGFGVYLILQGKEGWKLGILLVLGGTAAIYGIMFQLMPYFRDYKDSWSGIERIAPFTDLGLKAKYIWLLLYPLAFVPVVFWKQGIIAGPAIGVNLISGMIAMYSLRYHHNDVISPLLFIATILALSKLNISEKQQSILQKRQFQWLLLLFAAYWLGAWPYSSLRLAWKAVPEPWHWELRQDVAKLDKMSEGKRLIVSEVLGPQIERLKIEALSPPVGTIDCAPSYRHIRLRAFPQPDYIALTPKLHDYLIDLKSCQKTFDNSEEFTALAGFKWLKVYQPIKK